MIKGYNHDSVIRVEKDPIIILYDNYSRYDTGIVHGMTYTWCNHECVIISDDSFR